LKRARTIVAAGSIRGFKFPVIIVCPRRAISQQLKLQCAPVFGILVWDGCIG